ncbi:MAG: LamG domain-containing protein [Planctomycetota bacterium]|jgi:hypothetical protein
MRTAVLVLSTLFFVAMSYTTSPAAVVVPGAVLYLDAADNPGHDDSWENLGTAGGELSSMDNPPELEDGTIEIADIDAVMTDSMFYTYKESGQAFGADGDEVELFFEDWTIEFLLRRNGDKLGPEHHLAGFQNIPAEGKQGIRLNLWEGPDDLTFSIHAGGGKAGVAPLNIKLELDKWNWIALVHENKNSLKGYQNGEEVSKQGGFDFDKKLPIDMVIIGANSYGERPRTFNGSISIVRVYDKALTDDQIKQNIDAWISSAAVEPTSKLATTWGREKAGH